MSDEAGGQPQNLPQFTKIVRTLVERQRKNVEWAITGKGPYRLHHTLQEHQVSEKTWCSMTMTDERQLYCSVGVLRLFRNVVKPGIV